MYKIEIPGGSLSAPNSQKKTYGRPKSAEPSSPLLRRALSPDRLHPRSAENKTSISPLANSVVKIAPRVVIAQSNRPETSEDRNDVPKDENELKTDKKIIEQQVSDYSKLTHAMAMNIANVGLSNSCGSTQLPRIAEEKDSPTGGKSEDLLLKEASSMENLQTGDAYDSKRIEKFLRGCEGEIVNKKVEQIKNESLFIMYDIKRNSCTEVDQEKNVELKTDHASSTSESSSSLESIGISDQRAYGSESMKISKRYKFEDSRQSSQSDDSPVVDDKKNK